MKNFSLAALFFLITSSAFAQIEIGIKLSPSIATTRVVAPDQFNFRSLNAKTHFGGGVILDYYFRENYAFSTGLIYNAKGAGVSYTDPTTSARRSDEYSIQYLEIPLTIKLFTNDVATDTKVFAGLSYHRGLIDVDDFYEQRNQFNNKNIEIKNSYVALDLGIKF